MEKFNKIMMTVYGLISVLMIVGMYLYISVDKVRAFINRHVMVPYVKACEKIGEEIEDMWYEENGHEDQ